MLFFEIFIHHGIFVEDVLIKGRGGGKDPFCLAAEAIGEQVVLTYLVLRFKTEAVKERRAVELCPTALVEVDLEKLDQNVAGPGEIQRRIGGAAEIFAVFRYHPIAALDHIHVLCHEREHLFQHCAVDIVVAVHKGEILAFGAVQTEVARSGNAAVGNMKDPDPLILGRYGVQQLGAAVRRAVVDDEDLQVRIGLARDAVKTAFDAVPAVVNGNDDGDLRLHQYTPFPDNLRIRSCHFFRMVDLENSSRLP